MARPTLDGNELIQLSFSGFGYPNTRQVVGILGTGSGEGGNAVLQQGAFGFRQASASWHFPTTAAKDVVRALYESGEVVAYVDHDGNATNVVVFEFTPQLLVGDAWTATATLLEIPA